MAAGAKPNTLFVIGAGASQEFGLPVGDALKDKLSALLNFELDHYNRTTRGDRLIWQTIGEECGRDRVEMRKFERAAELIVRGMPDARSIDNFIEVHRGDKHVERLSKLAIVKQISHEEQRSSLFVEHENLGRSINFKKNRETWLSLLMRALVGGTQKGALRDRLSDVALVVFNYDRCIEHHLRGWIINHHDLKEVDATELVNGMAILHPYGTVGRLPWQQGSEPAMAFGAEPDGNVLSRLASEIRTFSESLGDSEGAVEARRLVQSCEQIFFLGFGYIPINLQLLMAQRPRQPRTNLQVFGTAYEVSQANREEIRRDLRRGLGIPVAEHVELVNLTCSQFVRDYERRLAR